MAKGHEEKGLECPRTCRQIMVPTEDEIEALNALRDIKNRVREIKKRVRAISHSRKREDRALLGELTVEMTRLKGQWQEWDDKRQAATRERMILLGHEEES